MALRSFHPPHSPPRTRNRPSSPPRQDRLNAPKSPAPLCSTAEKDAAFPHKCRAVAVRYSRSDSNIWSRRISRSTLSLVLERSPRRPEAGGVNFASLMADGRRAPPGVLTWSPSGDVWTLCSRALGRGAGRGRMGRVLLWPCADRRSCSAISELRRSCAMAAKMQHRLVRHV